MAIDGTGTKQDPYVVHDWDELTTAIADSTAYVTVADNVVIDLLDIYPSGIPTNAPILNFECKEFDGNGITLKNAYTLTSRTGRAVIELANTCDAFSNVNFVNFYINNGSGALYIIQGRKASNYPIISHCTIKGIMLSSATTTQYLFGGISKFFDCVINMKIQFSGNGYVYNQTSYDSCWLRFDTNSRWDYASTTNTFINSYLEGKFVAKANNTKVINLGVAVSSIVNAQCEAGNYTGCSIYAYTGSVLVLVNTDKLVGNISLSGSSASVYPIGVTDSQLKDDTYLPTIFPVVPYDEGGDDDDV